MIKVTNAALFFLAAGISLYTVLYDYFNKERFRWIYFIVGCIVGGISLLPWVVYILNNSQHSYFSWRNIADLSFYRFWMLDIHGLNLFYSLGGNFQDFIKEPFIGETGTYVIGVLHIFLAVTGLMTVVWIFRYIAKTLSNWKSKKYLDRFFKNVSMARFYLSGILIGLGILMTMSGTEIYPHYLICAFPFSYIFLVKVHNDKKILLRCILISQLIITFAFLNYIHQHGGALRGDYKRTYQVQMQYNISN